MNKISKVRFGTQKLKYPKVRIVSVIVSNLDVAIAVPVNVVIVAIDARFEFEFLHKLKCMLPTLGTNHGNVVLLA